MAEATAAVPSQFNYSPIPVAVGGYASQQKNLPSNGSVFSAGQMIEIPIVTGRVGQFIDPARSYLMFAVKHITTSNVGFMLERVGAAAFIENFELYLNGQPLEQIWGYNAIAQLVFDLYYGVGRSNLLNFVEGCAYTSPMGVSLASNGALWSATAANVVGNNIALAETIAIVSQGHFSGAGSLGLVSGAPTATYLDPGLTLGARSNVQLQGQASAATQFINDGTADAAYTAVASEYTNFQIVPNTIIMPTTATMASRGPSGTYAAAAGTQAGRLGGRYFAIPLISGLLGTLATKMFPALTFAPGSLMLRLKTCQPAAPGVQINPIAASYTGRERTGTTTAGNFRDTSVMAGGFNYQAFNTAHYWTLSDISFVTTTVTLQTGVSASILSAAQAGALDLHTKSFTDVYATIPALATAATVIAPIRKLSVNTLFAFFRDAARETGYRGGGFLSRLAPTGAAAETFQFYYIFGNERVREYPYLRQVEYMVENLRALHEWTDLEINFGPALRPIPLAMGAMDNLWVGNLSASSWVNPVGGFFATICDNAATATSGGVTTAANGAVYTADKWSWILQNAGFFLGMDLDTFSGTTGTSRSGRNTTGDQITLFLENGLGSTALFPGQGRTVRIDFVAFHDLRINIQASGIAVPLS